MFGEEEIFFGFIVVVQAGVFSSAAWQVGRAAVFAQLPSTALKTDKKRRRPYQLYTKQRM